MNLQSCFKKLQDNNDFIILMRENPNAFLCSGFFTIDKQGDDNKQHLDFFIPENGKIFSFQIEEGKMMPLEIPESHVPEKLAMDFDIDFEKIEEKINDKMRENEINNRIQKLIFALQKVGGKNTLLGTVFLSMFGLLRININLENGEITDFEKKSLFDMMSIFKKK